MSFDTLRYLLPLKDLYTERSSLYLGVGLLTTLYLYRYLFPKEEKNAIRKLGGFPIFTTWKFFTERYDFIWENFRSDPSPHFKFNVLHVSPLFFVSLVLNEYWQSMQHNVIALRGEEARKAYFDNKSLSFAEGYKVLMGGVRLSFVTSYQWICSSEYLSLGPFGW